ncbi:hypothetical protein PsorP6_011085 [Peronosclerospora sorghi]|uniref:Uncharacterized protein n=1 Tax=Peronosclerospora sorghi TaxID=230839 RepID=A0ACC0VUR4_9STRA|nr:hypothetical protein PsorP6_011085 [Peronosclerospora sorghi]
MDTARNHLHVSEQMTLKLESMQDELAARANEVRQHESDLAVEDDELLRAQEDADELKLHLENQILSKVEVMLLKKENAILQEQLEREKLLPKHIAEMVHAEYETIFEELWSKFQERYQSYETAVEYLRKTCIDPFFKEKFIVAWTNKVTHFGHSVTSRGEGGHGRLKKYLGTSRLDLIQCCKRIKQSMENFLTDYRAELANDRMQIPLFAHPSPRSDILQNVTKAISNFALKKINDQVRGC